MGRTSRRYQEQCLRAGVARAVREERHHDALILLGLQDDEEEEEEEMVEEEDEVEVIDPDIEVTPIERSFGRFEELEPRRMDAKELAFSALVTGVNPTKAFDFLRLLNWWVPTPKEFYKCQREVCEVVTAFARESMEQARKNMAAGAVISFDGSWDHPRHGSNCSLSVFDQVSGKVVDLVVTSRKVDPGSENYCENPSLMETEALKLCVERLKKCDKIAAYVHDNDGRARKVITDSGWGIEEKLDPGHVFKSFERHLASFKKKNGDILSDIEESLKKWFKDLVYSDLSPIKKVFQWLIAINHYRGCHCYCRHEDGAACHRWQHAGEHRHIVALVKFLSKSRKFLMMVDPKFSTQLNENFNRIKLMFAPKYICWGYSYEARVLCAVLKTNVPDWIVQLRSRLGLPPLFPENLRRFMLSVSEYEGSTRQRRRPQKRPVEHPVPVDQRPYAYRGNPYHADP